MELFECPDWIVTYDVSAGMDIRLDGRSTQHFNPFNGDIVAPKVWFSLGLAESLLCAHTAECCLLFVFEYVKESGLLLDSLAQALGVPSIHIASLEPNSVRVGDVCNGLKGVFTGVKFPRPLPVLKTSPACCELHAVLAFAHKSQDPYFRPLLESKTSTSGHLDVKMLTLLDPDGGWEPFIDAWDSGTILTRMNVPEKTHKKKKH